MSSESETTNISGNRLKDRWESVRASRSEIAVELDRMSKDLVGMSRKQQVSLANWFRDGSIDYEDAIRRPDVLAICLPLVESANVGDGESFSRQDILLAARQGFCSISKVTPVRRKFLQIMFFPIIALLGASLILLGFSFWVLPDFEKVFAEFGIPLPVLTNWVLGLGQWIRKAAWGITLVVLVVPVIVWVLGKLGRARRPVGLSWLDEALMSRNAAVGVWASHLSFLLQSGLSQGESLLAAGGATGKSWLRKISFDRAEDYLKDAPPRQTPFFGGSFPMLDRVLTFPNRLAKIELLDEVAVFYQDRNRSRSDWWISWLAAIIVWFVILGLTVGIFSLFMPLLAVVSGLTGGGF